MATETLSYDQALALIKEKGYQLRFARDIPPELQLNRDIVMRVLECGSMSAAELPDALRADREFMLEFALAKGYGHEDLPETLRGDIEFMRTLIATHPAAYEHASEAIRADKAIAMGAVADASMMNLFYVPEPLRHDREVLLTAMKARCDAFRYVPEDMRSDPELVRLAVDSCDGDSCVVELLPESVRSDKTVMLRFVAKDAYSFRHAAPTLRDDKEIVLAAAGRAWDVLNAASPRLRADRDVAMAVVTQGCNDFQALAQELRDDPEIVRIAVANKLSLDRLSERWRDDEATVRAAVANGSRNYTYASDRLKAVRDLALFASRGHERGSSEFDLEQVPMPLRSDPEIVEHAIRSCAHNAKFLTPDLLADDAFLGRLVAHSEDVIQHLPAGVAERVATCTISSPVYRGVAIIADTVPDAGYVRDKRRVLDRVCVVRDGQTTLSVEPFVVLTFEDDGPVGSYLSVRFIRNIVALGEFCFLVERNSGDHTSSSSGDAALEHLVWLLHEATGTLADEAWELHATLIYRGRNETLPVGVQLFRDASDYYAAIAMLSQTGHESWDSFRRLGHRAVVRTDTPVEEFRGAARVLVDGHGWRWLIPHADGSLAALARLRASDDGADWAWLCTRLADAHESERELIIRHFAQTPYSEEVRDVCSVAR